MYSFRVHPGKPYATLETGLTLEELVKRVRAANDDSIPIQWSCDTVKEHQTAWYQCYPWLMEARS